MNIIVVLCMAACQFLANQQQPEVKAKESKENGVLVVRHNIFAVTDVPVVGALAPAPVEAAATNEVIVQVQVQPVNENYVIDGPSKYTPTPEMSQDEVRALTAYRPKADWSYHPTPDKTYQKKTDWTYHPKQE